MQRRVIRSWRREVSDGSALDHLCLEVELVLDDGAALSAWSLTARLERAGGGPLVRGGLAPRGAVSIHHVFRNHIVVSGELDVIASDEAIIIWAKLQYGFDRDTPQYFEGALAEWPLRGAPPPAASAPLPPPVVPDDALDPELAIVAPAGDHGDLFPYMHVRRWPEPAREQIEERFVCYPHPLDAPPSGQLVQRLVALRAQGGAGAREAMQAVAVSYLEGRFDADAPFLDGLDRIDAPLAAYGPIHALLAGRGRQPGVAAAEIWRLLGMTADDARRYLRGDAHAAVMVRIWQSYLALVVALGLDRPSRSRLARALIVEHVLAGLTGQAEAADPARLAARARAVIVLPGAIFPLPPGHGSPAVASPPDPGEAIVPYAVGDLLLVKHRLRGYALGELAYVESVGAGERRESTRRQLDRTIESTVQARADAGAQDHRARSSSSSLASEVLGTLADTVVTTTYNDFGTSYGPPTTATLGGGWTAEHKPVGSPSQEDLTRFARDVLSKTVHRIAHQVAEVRSRSSQRDSEEAVTRVVDNAHGARNLRALYWWLDEVHAARVLDHGHRLLVEMFVPAPAAQLIERERAPEAGHPGPPVPPAALGIESFEDIGRHNFPALVARYPGGDLELPPAPRRVVSAVLRSGEPRAVELPEGYRATGASLGYAVAPGPPPATIQGLVGRRWFQISASSGGIERLELDGEDGVVQVAVASIPPLASPPDAAALWLALEIEAAPTEHTMDAWRLRTFQAIQRGYAAQREACDRARMPDDARPEAVRPRASARAIEHKELRRGAIELLFARVHHRVGAGDRARSGAASGELELAQPRYLQFFDSVFEWREMTCSFLSARPADPAVAALAARFGDDRRFTEFLEAAYARLVIPVALANAPALLFFLASGELWDVPDPHVAVHHTDLALASELFDAAGAPDAPRVVRELPSIRVPTSITVLADGDVHPMVDGASLAPGAGR
jgi:hypothetical protein